MKKTITILGSTGSVGLNTLRVIRECSDRCRVAGLAAGSNAAQLQAQIDEFGPRAVYIESAEGAAELSRANGRRVRVFSGKEGLAAFAEELDSDVLMAATTGITALEAVLKALGRGRRVALANKEILVMAGRLVMQALREHPDATLVPVDSEHNAIFQCLQGHPREGVEKLILTSSGGPLRDVDAAKFEGLSKAAVIDHPRWKMGPKISVDSATMMNKGLEIIEASWLFGFEPARIEVLVHPEAIVHSMVEFKDGSVLAQMGVTDMQLPIRHALCYPDRGSFRNLRLDLAAVGNLTFYAPDTGKFPCLGLAMDAARRSGSAPCVLNAADEAVVGAFLNDRIGFAEIPRIIESVLSRHRHVENPDLSEIRSIHRWALEETGKLCQAR